MNKRYHISGQTIKLMVATLILSIAFVALLVLALGISIGYEDIIHGNFDKINLKVLGWSSIAIIAVALIITVIIVIWLVINMLRGIIHANGNIIDYIVYIAGLFMFFGNKFLASKNLTIVSTLLPILVFIGLFVVRSSAKKENRDNSNQIDDVEQ